jgi:hypothetical protein
MICLGYTDEQKAETIAQYRAEHEIEKVFVLSPGKFATVSVPDAEFIEYETVIKYKVFYRLLQEIDGKTLIVVNECLRTQNRHDLAYNCIRQYLNQTHHQIVLQYLPVIESLQDFMTLLDFDTQSRWKREQFSPALLDEVDLRVLEVTPEFVAVPVPTTKAVRAAYQKEKRKLINGIGLKDPHTIPRNLYLMSGKAKASAVSPEKQYIGRNTRLKLANQVTYKEDRYDGEFTVFEFCHNAIDFADFLALSRQQRIEVLVADLKVDQWYFERFTNWRETIQDAYAAILKRSECSAGGPKAD